MGKRPILFLLLVFQFLCFKIHAQDQNIIIRQGHRKVINMVKYGPDGAYVFSAGDDGMVKMWDVNSGIDVKTYNGHSAPVRCIQLSSDGQYMISGDDEGVILIWKVGDEKQPVRRMEGHEGGVNVIEFMPGEKEFLTGGNDKLIKHWKFESGDLIKTIEGLTGVVRAIGVSPDGTRIIEGGQRANDVELLLIDAVSGQILDDALKHVKGAGAAKAWTYAVLTPMAMISSIGKGKVDKDMLNFFIFDYSNIEFTHDGQQILISQNLYLPMTAAKGEEDKTGGTTISIVELTEDRNMFKEVKKNKRWALDYPRTRAIFNKDQTKIIANINNSIRIYDMTSADFPTDQKEAMDYEPPVLKEFTGDVDWLTSIAISPDYRTVVSAGENRNLNLWDIESGRKIRSLEGYVQPALAVDVMPDGRHILVGSLDKNMMMWDYTTGQLAKYFTRSSDVNCIDISKDGKYAVTTAVDTRFFKLWNLNSGNIINTFMEKDDAIVWVKFDEDPDQVLALTEKGELKRWSIEDEKIKKVLKEDVSVYDDKYANGEIKVDFNENQLTLMVDGAQVIEDNQAGLITDAVVSPDMKCLVTTNEMGEISVYRIDKNLKAVTMILIDDFDYITFTPDFYYTSSKGASKAIAYKKGDKLMPFEQIELQYNRPDKVAKNLGFADEKLVRSYEGAYQKRLQRLGYEQEDLDGEIQLPEINIHVRELPLATTERKFEYTLQAQDKNYMIERVNVYINDVPVFGKKGIILGDEKASQLNKTISLDLSMGLNEIKTSVTNEKGFESIPEVFEINYEGPYYKPDLYMVSLGVSQYQDAAKSLKYATKDAIEVTKLFNRSEAFNKVYTKLFVDQEVTPDNLNSIESFIKQAKIDDAVIIFVAGHGMLDSQYDYYFGTPYVDFNNPSQGGIPYTFLENLLDLTPSRNKLLIMDTCHSGELDKEDIEEVEASNRRAGKVGFNTRAGETAIQYKENSFGLRNTFELSKSLFGDLNKGTGATVISASSGVEYAMESLRSENGLMTFCLLEGVNTRRADLNRDRKYTVSEFRSYMSGRLLDISDGLQKPSSREENIKNDFVLY